MLLISFEFFFVIFSKIIEKIRMASESNEKQNEVTDFVASDLPDQTLPSEKDTIQLALLLKSRYKRTVCLDSEDIGKGSFFQLQKRL